MWQTIHYSHVHRVGQILLMFFLKALREEQPHLANPLKNAGETIMAAFDTTAFFYFCN